MNMKKKIWIIVLASVAAIALAVTAVVALTSGEAKKSWQEQYDMGVRYLSNGNYEEAVIAFTAAIEIDPKNPDLYIGRADAYMGLGDTAAARTDYETALELDDTLADAWLSLAETYVAEGDIEKALEILQDAAAKTGDPRIKARIEELEALSSNIRWTFENGTLTISGEGPMKDYGSSSDVPWSDRNSEIERVIIEKGVTSIGNCVFWDCPIMSVEIPNSVTVIGDYAFNGCSNLTSVVIPDSVMTIGRAAFQWCDTLTNVEIPDSVTVIGDHAFFGCDNLTGIEIPDSVMTIGEASFSSCINLQRINVETKNQNYVAVDGVLFSSDMAILYIYPSGKEETSYEIPGSVAVIDDSAFFGCNKLSSIKIPDSVTTIGNHAFESCDNLTSAEIPNRVTMIGEFTFDSCGHLTSIEIPNSVTTISSRAFSCCTRLTSVRIPDSVTTIGNGAFLDCYNLMSVEIPDSVKMIGESAFEDCDSLTSIEIPNSVTMIGASSFQGCDQLQSINVEAGNQYYASVDGVLFSRDMTLLHTYPAGKEMTSYEISNRVTTIGYNAFAFCNKLTSVILPNSVATISDFAFYHCDNITSVEMSNNVTKIGSDVFGECENLTSVKIPDSVTMIDDWAFNGCYNLSDLYYGGTANQWATLTTNVFVPETTTIHYNYSK